MYPERFAESLKAVEAARENNIKYVHNIENTNNIKINGIEISEGEFEINLTSADLTNVVLDATSTIDNKLTLSNLKLIIKYYDDILFFIRLCHRI